MDSMDATELSQGAVLPCEDLSLQSISYGSLNVPIEHHPTIRYMVYNGYYKVMSNIPKMGHLPTPVSYELYSGLQWFSLHQSSSCSLPFAISRLQMSLAARYIRLFG